MVIVFAACGRSPRDEEAERARELSAPRVGEAWADRPHVVFTKQSLLITTLNVPVRLPATLPSRPSPDTIRVGDSSVVVVQDDGSVIALREGRTRIEAVSGKSTLDVEVLPAQAIDLSPGRARIERGGTLELQLTDVSSGKRLPASAATWITSSPERLVVRDGVAYATGVAGPVTVLARYGDAEAQAEIEVQKAVRLELNPADARMRPGDVRLFRLEGGNAGERVAWSSTAPRVLASAGQGLFQARKNGRARVCAAALEERVCAIVEVAR
ncbi:hypothetical protein [Anaeromyxobacter sp. SG26]|uniref:hypothetical protein n=1 Tax=Anaeromyxobacter sp. SG26 TaxID=2925407 RepID=UPI001F5931F2|nr:hypothetical protein [Anaeromyxobacter sp. SG26]